MTLMSVVVAVLATGMGILLIYGMILLGRLVKRKWKARQAGWWKVRGWRPRTDSVAGCIGRGSRSKAVVGQHEDEERSPLLGAA